MVVELEVQLLTLEVTAPMEKMLALLVQILHLLVIHPMQQVLLLALVETVVVQVAVVVVMLPVLVEDFLEMMVFTQQKVDLVEVLSTVRID